MKILFCEYIPKKLTLFSLYMGGAEMYQKIVFTLAAVVATTVLAFTSLSALVYVKTKK